MPKYCCFWHPQKYDYGEKTLDDPCPVCGKPYRFVLDNIPKAIGNYTIDRAIDRGFYSVVYAARKGRFGAPVALKVAPLEVYTFYGKDFESECETHHEIAQSAAYIVNIRDLDEHTIRYPSVPELRCGVAELDYINGESLASYLDKHIRLPAKTIGQIAIDLFRIVQELEQRNVSHNDLHAGNVLISQLRDGMRRLDGALDDEIKAVVVDLGSVSDESKSDDDRLGDIHWIVTHLRKLVSKIVLAKDDSTPEEVRLAQLLEDRSYQFTPSITSQRSIHYDECVDHIKRAFSRVRTSWAAPLELQNLDHGYNAQSLDPWHVPFLIVDPNEQWLRQVSAPGPQIITGMRGCGKTMLLLSLQFHARATLRKNEQSKDRLSRINEDNFVGLYVNGGKLLDNLGRATEELINPYEKLLVGFALDATRSVRHLSEISNELVSSQWYVKIGAAMSDYLEGTNDELDVMSDHELEIALVKIMVSLNRGEERYRINAHPATVFGHLGEAVRSSAECWSTNTILFLLDDVSTRYFKQKPIQNLFSSLLFQSPSCAFKITSEAQTLELVLQSPGGTEAARPGRDYDIFDLGAEVLQQMKIGPSRSGVAFIEKILNLRTEHTIGLERLRRVSTSYILGDCTLKSIALNICKVSQTSARKKKIYYGITALASVCVGDIGDIIALYEMIIARGVGQGFPIASEIQSGCYQDLCSRRLYHLNRRGKDFRNFALSFAEASHQLLVDSYNKFKKIGRKMRLRQYTKLYVRLTTSEADWQFNKLRQLVDSGVFVLEGGSDTPRTKTKDSDPVRQFILTYRKLFGLSNFIGIAERDRFELSGDDLGDWLLKPHEGKEILMRNLATLQEVVDDEPSEEQQDPEQDYFSRQPDLWSRTKNMPQLKPSHIDRVIEPTDEDLLFANRWSPSVKIVRGKELARSNVKYIYAALGFEARSVNSLKRIFNYVNPDSAILVRYDEKGRADTISQLAEDNCNNVSYVNQDKILSDENYAVSENALIDVSGMTKPVIFRLVKRALQTHGQALVAHTHARDHYPLNADIEQVLSAEEEKDHYKLLEGLSKLLRGESGPYNVSMLQKSDADETRKRVLCAFASAKHERLLSFLDAREFDVLDVFLINNDTPRSKLAYIAADVATKKSRYCVTTPIDTNDLKSTAKHLSARYHQWFVRGGCNLEIALTGSKIQTTASAIVCAAFKFSHCWYVGPKKYDVDRFSKGVGPTEYFRISIKQ